METNAALWEAEYREGGIPSSVRETPSGAVVWALDQLRQKGARLKTAVDAGCGKGRNSLYLAAQGLHVLALDFTPNAIASLQHDAAARHLEGYIHTVIHDVTEPWPAPEREVDLVVDTFCFKHLATPEAQRAYRDNLLTVLGMRGHYLISFASIGDGYYGQYTTAGEGADETVVIDPANGIESVLFSRERVLEFFAPELTVLTEIRKNKTSTMHGKDYPRETYAMLFQRNPRR